MAGLLLASVLSTAVPAAADTQVGTQDWQYASSGNAQATYGKPESKLWFNDGTWWGVFLPLGKGFHIYRFDPVTQTWADTGRLVDSRRSSRQDVLWDGIHLYVASHVLCQNCSKSGVPANLYRYSYDPVGRTYTLDAGFPVQINTYSCETLVLDKDSTGRLWATWVQGPSGNRQVYVASTDGTDTAWATPFVLPLAHTLTANDDISSLVAFGGNIGVLWGNQTTGAFYFGVHPDASAPGTGWTEETALSGTKMADDHINLKADPSGNVYAAVKTSKTSADAPLIELLVRDAASSSWTAYPVSDYSQHETRPIVLVDAADGKFDIFLTGPPHGGTGGTDSGGSIYEKTTAFASPSFDRKDNGVLVMHDITPTYGDNLNNVTSTKQEVSPATGELVEASNAQTTYYWHAWEPTP